MVDRSQQLNIQNVTAMYRHQGGDLLVIKDLSIDISEKEFICLLGPSGCGKTTLLNIIAGFVKPQSGSVTLYGKPIIGPGPDRGFVFQKNSLFPWKTIKENIEFGPRMKGMDIEERKEIVSHYADAVGLSEFLNSYPFQLSGGMQQRANLARAFASNPDILLMDEPFASLDALTRNRMQQLLIRVWSLNTKTVIFVTHSVDEALLLASRIIVLSTRPAQILSQYNIHMPQPRDMSVIDHPLFNKLRKDILGDLQRFQ